VRWDFFKEPLSARSKDRDGLIEGMRGNAFERLEMEDAVCRRSEKKDVAEREMDGLRGNRDNRLVRRAG